jgi:uncharacterized MAPEG superfamily protein
MCAVRPPFVAAQAVPISWPLQKEILRQCRYRPGSIVSGGRSGRNRDLRHPRTQEAKVTTDLRYLAYMAMLTAALWIPYIVCQVITNGPLQPKNYLDPALPRPVPAWGQRAHRAYLNAIEVFAPFAALVVVAHLTGKANEMTALWSASFFYLRLAHAVIYWTGLPWLRTILFTLAFVAEVGIFREVIK